MAARRLVAFGGAPSLSVAGPDVDHDWRRPAQQPTHLWRWNVVAGGGGRGCAVSVSANGC